MSVWTAPSRPHLELGKSGTGRAHGALSKKALNMDKQDTQDEGLTMR
jgi:hypothetical protein